MIWVAVRLPGQGPSGRVVIVKSFRSFWRSLQKMAALAGRAWRQVCVCNAAHMRNVPGRKTDHKDRQDR